MMKHVEETDNITKNIVQEIVRECRKIKLEIDEKFCIYYVKLLTLDPHWKISPEKKLNRRNIQAIVTFIIKKFRNPKSFDLVTLKIQHLFLSNSAGRDNIIEMHNETMKTALKPLVEDIVSFAIIDDTNKILEHKLFRKIALYSTLQSGLGNPKHASVIKEALFALRSIFEEKDITNFLDLKRDAKINELTYFQNLISGIRLFHRDCGRPSAEIEDLPKIVSQALIATISELQNGLLYIMEEVNLCTSCIDNIFVLTVLSRPKILRKNGETYKITMKLVPTYPEGVTEKDVKDIINLLILSRQREVYIRKLLKNIEQVELEANILFNKLHQILTNIHNVVKYKVAVSVNVVYPLFVELAETWKKIQDEAVLLSVYYQIYQTINKLSETIKYEIDKTMKIIENDIILTDAMRLEKTMGLKISQENNLCEVLDPSQINKLQLQYLGFCIWSLVQTEGGLIPGNPNMGVCKWNNKYYAFSSVEAAFEFGSNPNMIILQALTIVRKKPELISLLQLQEIIHDLRDIGDLFEKPIELIMTENVGIQTEVHPIPEYIDPNYVWNTWDYYRDAIKLANISRSLTHSMQTKKSQFRCPMFTQTVEPRDKNCQTKKDNYMNVATPSNFIYGLRGRRDDIQHIIDLTRPIEDEYFPKCVSKMKNIPSAVKIKQRSSQLLNKNEEQVPDNLTSTQSLSKDYTSVKEEELSECLCVTELQLLDE